MSEKDYRTAFGRLRGYVPAPEPERCVTCGHVRLDHFGWVGDGPAPQRPRSGCNLCTVCAGWRRPATVKEVPRG